MAKSSMNVNSISKRLVAAYVFDWIIIIIIAAIGAAINKITPNYHAFSLLDFSISYPVRSSTISTTALALASVIGPAIIIFLVALIFVRAPSTSQNFSRARLLRWKLWEWNTGWMGLALSCATALLISQGMKNIIGKPRPHMLAVCNPDLVNIPAHVVGGYGQDISQKWTLVESTICLQTDRSALDEAFRSFPSGHATISFAGLLYLTLFLCSKFSVVFPYLPTQRLAASDSASSYPANNNESRARPSDAVRRPILLPSRNGNAEEATWTRHRDEAAAPPTYLLFLAYVPIGVAIYISGSRYFNYQHHGFDILFGDLIGILTAWFAFRWYHLSMMRGSGWSWGPRSRDRAFGIGVGAHGYVDEERRFGGGNTGGLAEDLEMAPLDISQNQGYQRNGYQHTTYQNGGQQNLGYGRRAPGLSNETDVGANRYPSYAVGSSSG